MRKSPRVALLIETSRAYGRGLLQGVIRYLRAHDQWSLYVRPHDLGAPVPSWLKHWHGDGILARIEDRRAAEVIRRTGVPAVDLRFSVPNTGLPGVGIDNRAVVELAFQHLRDAGFKQFGFCSVPRGRSTWMDLRCELFQGLVRAAGLPCHVHAGLAGRRRVAWEEEQEEIAAWVSGLPKPIGVMACNDDRGIQVTDACRRAKVLVPDEVAVIGVDNDEILSNLSNPPLSSVDINTPRIGYEAAALLSRMMAGKPAPAQPVFLAPRGVVARGSTDVLATSDRDLALAIRFLREHACEGLRLKEAPSQILLSLRTLERRTYELLGRSPREEVMRVRLERAKQLLTETDLLVGVIAAKSGFSQAKYFSQAFHAKLGVTPGQYRQDTQKSTCERRNAS
jgi:LacI family transcriptional regulator